MTNERFCRSTSRAQDKKLICEDCDRQIDDVPVVHFTLRWFTGNPGRFEQDHIIFSGFPLKGNMTAADKVMFTQLS